MSNLWIFNEDNSGLTYAYADQVLKDYQELFQSVFPDINLEPSTAIGQIVSALAQDDLNLIDKMRQTSDYFFNGGSGLMLDMWAYNNFRVARKSAIPSNVVVTIYGIPNAKIPKNFIVSDGKFEYHTEKEYVIPLSGEIDILCVANDIYSEASLSNTINIIITPAEGVERVNNSNPSNIGLNQETDSQLYLRCMEMGSTFRNSSLRSILANIAQLNNVIKVAGFENKTNQPITERNVRIPAHSFIAIVLGGDDTEIAESISYSKPVGAGTTGNTEIPIMVNGKENVYKFERPSYLALKVQVVCKLNLSSPKSYQQMVKDAVLQYIDKLEIGDYITQPALAQAISAQAYNFDIIDVKFGTKEKEVVTYEQLSQPLIYAYPPYKESQTLYKYTGDAPTPEGYEVYSPTQTPLFTKNGNDYEAFETTLYTKTTGADPQMVEFSEQLYYKFSDTTLYNKTGAGSMPENYILYTPPEPLYEMQDGQYIQYSQELYLKFEGIESGEMTQLRQSLYVKRTHIEGGTMSYNAIQLDLNQLALINASDISVS